MENSKLDNTEKDFIKELLKEDVARIDKKLKHHINKYSEKEQLELIYRSALAFNIKQKISKLGS